MRRFRTAALVSLVAAGPLVAAPGIAGARTKARTVTVELSE